MCLIAFDLRGSELTLAANRDEFHHRPSLAADWWDDAPQVWGGRDQQAGGSWLAVSRAGRLAAVTNVRRMLPPRPEAPSRGALVQAYLSSQLTPADFAAALKDPASSYAGFNLLLADRQQLLYVSNEPEFTVSRIGEGVHVLSNAQLDTPWPKSERLRGAMIRRSDQAQQAIGELFTALGDRRPAPDPDLPDTGVGLEMERFLSAPFICSPRYGTRASTVLQWRGGTLRIEERRFDPQGQLSGRSEAAFEVPERA